MTVSVVIPTIRPELLRAGLLGSRSSRTYRAPSRRA
jgi:hypothetical protein